MEPVYHRHTLAEAEHCAARLEVALEKPFMVERVGPSRWRIRPGRLMAAISINESHVLQEYPDGTSAIAR